MVQYLYIQINILWIRNSPGHPKLAWDIWSGAQLNSISDSPGHPEWSARVVREIICEIIYGPEQDCIIVQDNQSWSGKLRVRQYMVQSNIGSWSGRSKVGPGNCLWDHIWSGALHIMVWNVRSYILHLFRNLPMFVRDIQIWSRTPCPFRVPSNSDTG